IHPAFLHKNQWPWRAPTPDRIEFFETEWALISRAHPPAAKGYPQTESIHASVFPAMSMAVDEPTEPLGGRPAPAAFSPPIADTHTAQLGVMYSPVERKRREPRVEESTDGEGSTQKQWGESQPAFGIGFVPYGEYLDGRAHPQLGYDIPVNPGIEDH